jgi:hypothetical protein
MTRDQNRTALQLGHRDTDLLYNHYRGLATREAAARYWNIRPAAEARLIQMPKVG